MPGKSGPEPAELVRHPRRDINIALTSGYFSEESSPSDVHCAKPWRVDQVPNLLADVSPKGTK